MLQHVLEIFEIAYLRLPLSNALLVAPARIGGKEADLTAGTP